MRDVIVAGGGPVGLAAALYAQRVGLDVVVREPRTGPIDKACGEGLMPGAVAGLHDLGVAPAGHPIAGIRYLDGRHQVDAPFGRGPGLGVRRTTLHAALLDAADRAGIAVCGPAVRQVHDRGDHLLVDGEPTRYLLAADGLHSRVRRLVGLDGPQRPGGYRRHGLRRHVACRPWTDFVEVHWSAVGEAYVTPIAERQIGVALLTTRTGRFEDLITGFPGLAERLAGLDAGPVRGAGPLRQRVRGRVRGRVLLIGDAAGYVDALTGEGLALGLAQARAAVASVRTGQVERYEAAARRLGRRHTALTLGLLTATRLPAVRRGLVPAAHHLPAVFRAAVDQLARPA
ncbi:NAD(P)/FAD-dependent oxidoreductase [Nakamurella sp.]|uniref:NAD(P)/FAD-dependent oxidoreductase n=1 Tax=Nakamurella sp. TaxID=1869182 RepID=UPI003782DFE8